MEKSNEQIQFEAGNCDANGICKFWDVHSGCCDRGNNPCPFEKEAK